MSSISCCGRQRMEFQNKGSGGSNDSEAVRLSYGGVQPIMVKGVFTGNFYRFAPGATHPVHPADAPFMVAIPGLRTGEPSL